MISNSKKNILRIGIWGFLAFHTQFLILIPFFTVMPRAGGWDGLAFVIALFLFGINLALNYAVAVMKIFRNEDLFADNIALIGIWTVLAFAQIKLADNLATYFHYKTAKV